MSEHMIYLAEKYLEINNLIKKYLFLKEKGYFFCVRNDIDTQVLDSAL